MTENDNQEDARQTYELSLDSIFTILAQHERCDLLSFLADSSEEAVPIDEVVEYMVQSETERLGEVPNRDHLELSLYHIHLPKLTDTGVIEYDSRSQQIRYWGNEMLEEWLERIQREEEKHR